MTASTLPAHLRADRRIAAAVAGLTLLGAVLRGWNLGRLGLTHFDEGIYALAGMWSSDPSGIGSLSPGLIPYAPAGFVLMVGVGYAMLGASDFSAILASQLLGIATIPVVAWLAGRTFGASAGLAAAALAACSGAHIAFSRMALTDATFLLAWLLAIGMGQRLLEMPNPWRGVMLGVAVGFAQQVKYNGWVAGGVVVGGALLGVLIDPDERRSARWLRVFGWGLLGAVVAALIVWPWYRFVERHGGYAGLLRHQRSYLGGLALWPDHLDRQFQQVIALSGGWPLLLAGWGLAAAGILLIGSSGTQRPTTRKVLVGRAILGLSLGVVFANLPWWACLATLPRTLTSRTPGVRLLGVAWATLAILTPFYHPYARLWLPLHALGWMLAAGWMTRGMAGESIDFEDSGQGRNRWISVAWLMAVAIGCTASQASLWGRSHPVAGLLDPTDSLRLASDRIAGRIPDEVKALKFLGRPSVTYYLGGKTRLWAQADLGSFTPSADPGIWGLYDSGVDDRSAGAGETLPPELARGWEVVASEMTILSIPTLLDLHPDASHSEASAASMRRAPLWLLRPRRAETLR